MSSVYPAAIDTDATLFVAGDNVQTKLSAPMAIGDAVAMVTSSAGWLPNMIATVDTEQMLVTSVAPNMIGVSRAFGGTSAAVHAAGKNVSNFVDSAYQAALKNSLIAVETALGPHLGNVTPSKELYSSTFDFGPLVSGSGVSTSTGNLVVGNNTLTFPVVPAGVNGTDNSHYLYVSGGTGTAEAVLITGGSGVAGAPGQIIIQCAFAHSGAWQIQTATAGVQEAVVASLASGWCEVIIPAGNWNVYAPTTIPFGMHLRGVGVGVAQLVQQTANAGIINVPDIVGFGALVISDMSLVYGVTATGGAALSIVNKNFPVTIRDLFIYEPWDGIALNHTAIELSNITIMRARHYGISSVSALGGAWSNIWISSPGSGTTTGNGEAGVHVAPNMDGLLINNFVCAGFKKGIHIDGTGGSSPQYLSNLYLTNAYIEDSVETGIKVLANGLLGGVYQFTNLRVASIVNSAGAAIEISYGGPTGSIAIANSFTYGHATGVFLNGTNNVAITGCNIHTTAAANSIGVWLDNTLARANAHVTISGNNIGFDPDSGGTTGAVPAYAIFVGTGSNIAAITGNNLNCSSPGLAVNGPDRLTAGSLIANNPGYNPVGPASITVGASPFTYTAGPSPEVVYVSGGTVSLIKRGASGVATASPAQITLPPFGTVQVTYSAVPIMVKDIL